MCNMVVYTAEPVSTRGSTNRLVKIRDVIYVTSDLEQVTAKVTQLNV